MEVSKSYHQSVVWFLIGIIILLFFGMVGVLYLEMSQTIVAENKVKTVPINSDEVIDDLLAPPSPYLKQEEVVIIPNQTLLSTSSSTILPVTKVLFEYIKVSDSCGIHYEGEDCVNVRGGPGLEFPVVTRLRKDIVLKVGGKVERDGAQWYKIIFDEHLFFPERLTSDWYVSADYVEVLLDEGDKTTWKDGEASTTKEIVINRTKQTLSAYENGELFMEAMISTGLEFTPTPVGTFSVFKKTPSRYMQGPLPGLPSDQYYDLPGVPWNLYFTQDGAVIHGAYWHDSFGSRYSHGCVNLLPSVAQTLYYWAPLGTKVIITD
jgi:hypothetical protein